MRTTILQQWNITEHVFICSVKHNSLPCNIHIIQLINKPAKTTYLLTIKLNSDITEIKLTHPMQSDVQCETGCA